MTKAKKRFGQNFLHDHNMINKIIMAIRPQAGQHIVEIGPGLGALTEHLIDENHQLDIIEIDRDLIGKLELQYGQQSQCRIYSADALAFAFDELIIKEEKLRIVGNLPYNISTPLLFHLANFTDVIDDMHFMLQKEVVDRIVAEPSNKSYGRLSVMMQYYFQVQSLFPVSRHCFKPIPQVESAVLRMQPHREKTVDVKDEQQLETVVRLAFNQRRKTIRNSLKTVITAQQLDLMGINPTARAEDLGLKDYANISNFLYKKW